MFSYLLIVGPGILLALYAQFKVKSAFNAGKQIRAASGMSGAETAYRILQAHNLENKVNIEAINSPLGDHYDPKNKTLRLSPDVYSGRSLSALGIAAHEVGHALQDAKGYAPLQLRNAVVPLASVGSSFSYFIIFLGIMLSSFGLVALGIILFSGVVIFQLINLPVEFDASNRAREILLTRGFITPAEEKTVGSVLNAAALTYVAATVTSILTLLYYVNIARER